MTDLHSYYMFTKIRADLQHARQYLERQQIVASGSVSFTLASVQSADWLGQV